MFMLVTTKHFPRTVQPHYYALRYYMNLNIMWECHVFQISETNS